MNPHAPSFVDFFAGSGLVTQGARHACVPVWSNDICPKRAAIHQAMRTEIATDLAGILPSMDEEAAKTVEHTKRAIFSRRIA